MGKQIVPWLLGNFVSLRQYLVLFVLARMLKWWNIHIITFNLGFRMEKKSRVMLGNILFKGRCFWRMYLMLPFWKQLGSPLGFTSSKHALSEWDCFNYLLNLKVKIHICMEEWYRPNLTNRHTVPWCSFYIQNTASSHVDQIITMSHWYLWWTNPLSIFKSQKLVFVIS